MFKKNKFILGVLVLTVFNTSIYAVGKYHPCNHNPPIQAIEACLSKTEDESCSFQGRGHKVEGICFNKDEHKACVPKHFMKKFKLHKEVVYPQYQRQNS